MDRSECLLPVGCGLVLNGQLTSLRMTVLYGIFLALISYLFEHVGISTYADIFTYTDNPIFAYKSYEHENGYAFADVSTYADDLIFMVMRLLMSLLMLMTLYLLRLHCLLKVFSMLMFLAAQLVVQLVVDGMLNNVDPRIAINIDHNTPRNDTYKERYVPSEQNVMDLEDFGSNLKSPDVGPRRIVRSFETKCQTSGLGASSMDKPDQGGSHQLFHVL
ncbi:hypothetical protein Tco_0598279 [Tanacetum coccineum]